MGVAVTREQVLALAPDDASAKAATGLLADSNWVTLGVDDEAIWGECKGSGAKPYQTQVDLAALAARCSCPSRKFPCKHGLALLLLYAQKHARLVQTPRPAWLDEWMTARKEKAAKKEQAVAAKPAVDPAVSAASAAKREEARWKRIESGAGDLQRWIADQFRRGLARCDAEQRREWRAMAARMVDAQAPGLGQQLEFALEALNAGAARQEEVIERLGLLQLLGEGVRRRALLSPNRLADVRSALGWPCDKEEVVATGTAIADDWQVLGQIACSNDERLSERRIWLRGERSARYALLQDFAFKGKGWETSWTSGVRYGAVMTFYPGSLPLRALASAQAITTPAPMAAVTLADAIDQASQLYADNPWLAQVPMWIDAATPMRIGEQWMLRTAAGMLPLSLPSALAWPLLACSGGHPLCVMGEWDGRRLLPLTAHRPAQSRPCWSIDGATEVV